MFFNNVLYLLTCLIIHTWDADLNTAWFPFGIFSLCCLFWFFVPTKNQNKQCNVQMETSTKSQNEQQKAKASNQRHLPVLVFEIQLILSQKQERASKSIKKQCMNDKWKHTPKTKTSNKKQQRAFFIPIFLNLLQL